MTDLIGGWAWECEMNVELINGYYTYISFNAPVPWLNVLGNLCPVYPVSYRNRDQLMHFKGVWEYNGEDDTCFGLRERQWKEAG